MSKFTGGHDLYDEIKTLGDGNIERGFERFDGTKVYIQTEEKFQDITLTWKQALARSRKPVKYNSLLDLAPYFPHLVQSQTIGRFGEHVNNIVLITRKPAYELCKCAESSEEMSKYKTEFNSQLLKWQQGEKIT